MKDIKGEDQSVCFRELSVLKSRMHMMSSQPEDLCGHNNWRLMQFINMLAY